MNTERIKQLQKQRNLLALRAQLLSTSSLVENQLRAQSLDRQVEQLGNEIRTILKGVG